MSEGREIVRRGTARMSSVAYILQHLLGRFNEELFPEREVVNIGGRRIKCIRFVDDMDLLQKMLMELNERCEDYDMKINISKTKPMVIGRKPKEDRYTD